MDKWLKIKEKIRESKLTEVKGLFAEKLPTKAVNEWTNQQIHKEDCLKLNLTEYAELKKCVSEEDKFLNAYNCILDAKDCDLKLEVAAELIEEKKFPLDIFVEWFLTHKDLPEEQFNEELGEFWGDVWRHAAGGAGAGALAGSAVGALGTGGLGTWAGTGLGALAGGAGGALYGAGKGLLRKVLQYRKDQKSFEATKQEVLSLIKNLKDYSQKFNLGPQFEKAIDTFVDELGNTRAYQVTQPKTSTPVAPTTPVTSPVTSPVTVPAAPTTPVSPPVPSPVAGLPGSPPPATTSMKSPATKKNPPPAPPEPPKDISFNSVEDLTNYYNDAQKKYVGSEKYNLERLGAAISMAASVEGEDVPAIEVLNKYINTNTAKDISKYNKDHKEEFVKTAGEYVKSLEEKEAEVKPEEPKVEPAKPPKTNPPEGSAGTAVIKDIGKPANKTVEPMSEKELRVLGNSEFKKYAKEMGLEMPRVGHPGDNERNNAIDELLDFIEKGKNKAAKKIKESVSPTSTQCKTDTLSFKEKVDYYKDLFEKRIKG